ncbi:hypothetical protein OESDEN_04999 [Oesophagostomum dentatum]|uniref:Leucine--tRNA ligase RagD-binding domain-containing protein n=1 Tax=Oesophagostomum dentatum TaxID=61180 RepID=A0A0B1TBY6_OESDE|nr:hypothetical protein OESDEN_04999 [Oesophagostomum dentatum]
MTNFRARFKSSMSFRKKNTFAVSPSEAVIHVAKDSRVGSKQSCSCWGRKHRRIITEEVMNKAMPFVQMVKEQYEKKGMAALASACPFDQAAVLLENREYIESSVELDRFSIKFTDEADVERIISETAVP